MSVTTKTIGFVIKQRGEYVSNPETRYYKDNVVQYHDSSYIANPIDYDAEENPLAYVTSAPVNNEGVLNEGWKIFASGNNTFSTGEKVTEIGIDDNPTVGSNSLVKSGGVQNELALGAVYDVSAKNPTAGPNSDGKWESLSTLLSDANLSTLIPSAYRKGGMIIKFVQSSDNKYVQFRLMAQNFTTDVTQWQGVDDKPTAGSKNLVTSGGVILSTPKPHIPNKKLFVPQNIGKNLFNKNTVSAEPGYLNSRGEFIPATELSGWHVSDFIPVIPNEKYTLYNPYGTEVYNIFYDITGQNIVGNVQAQETQTFTIPSNAFYVKLSIRRINLAQFELGESATEYEEYSDVLTRIYGAIDDVQKEVDNASDIVGTTTAIEVKNTILYNLLDEHASKDGNVYTFPTSAVNNSYIGIKCSTLYNMLRKYVGKKINIEIKYKASGDTAHLSVSDLHQYPSPDITNQQNNISGDIMSFRGDWVVSNTAQNLYIAVKMQGASASASLEYIETNVYFCKNEEYEDSKNAELIKFIDSLNKEADKNETLLYCYPYSGTDDDTHFYGLTAIAKAIDAITDASYNNRYRIIIDGYFHFTDPLTLTSFGEGEYSVAFMKPFVSLEGTGRDKCVIYVDFPSDAVFHDGKTWSDYQPIYIACAGEVSISNMTILGKNCRYTVHLETDPDRIGGVVRNIKNCDIIHYGLDGFTGSYKHAIGAGIGYDHLWNIENCYLESPTSCFAMHSLLGQPAKRQGRVNFINCTFNGFITTGMYPQDAEAYLNFVGSNMTKSLVSLSTNHCLLGASTPYKFGNYATTKWKLDSYPLQVSNVAQAGKVLKIKAINENVDITLVTNPTTSSAFNYIFGDTTKGLGSAGSGGRLTDECFINNFGTFKRKGSVGLKSFIFGSIDCDESSQTGYRGLGKLLGDCSVTNKKLTFFIGSTQKTITFDEDYSQKDNAYVLGVINAALNPLATASIICPAIYMYPEFNGLFRLKCEDTTAILRGMGVIFTANGVRRATNSDGRIDGIAIDDIGVGSVGRVITKGRLFSYVERNDAEGKKSFTTLEVTSAQRNVGVELGISTTEAGKFDADASPKVLRAVQKNVLEIL